MTSNKAYLLAWHAGFSAQGIAGQKTWGRRAAFLPELSGLSPHWNRIELPVAEAQGSQRGAAPRGRTLASLWLHRQPGTFLHMSFLVLPKSLPEMLMLLTDLSFIQMP